MKRWFTSSTPFAPLVAAIALTAIGCGGDSEPTIPVYGTDVVTVPEETQNQRVSKGHYPLEAGWTWTYVRTFELMDPTDGSVQESATDSLRVEAMGEVDLGSVTAFGLATYGVEIYNGEVSDFTTEVYYLQDRHALTEIAYRGFGALVTPAPGIRTEGGTTYRVGDRAFGSVLELKRALAMAGPSEGWIDTEPAGRVAAGPAIDGPITFRDDPRKALVYPLRPGATWVSFTDPWTQIRTVEGHEPVRVPAGNFGSAHITTDVGIDPNVTWSDWVAAQGLVSREIGGIVEVTTPFSPDVTDTLLMVDRTVLIDFTRPHGGL
jgi:hypothetical protein